MRKRFRPRRSSIRCRSLAEVLLVGAVHVALASPPHLVVQPLHFDFGRTDDGTPIRCRFELINTGGEALIIGRVRPACPDCTQCLPAHTAIPAGASAPLEVRIETAGSELGGEADVHVCPLVPLSQPLIAVESDTPYLRGALAAGNGGCYVLHVSAVPPLPPGRTQGRLRILSGETNEPPCVVKITLVAWPALLVVPDRLEFRAHHAEQTRVLFVRPRAALPRSILDVTSSLPGVVCDIYEKPHPGRYRIYVTANRQGQGHEGEGARGPDCGGDRLHACFPVLSLVTPCRWRKRMRVSRMAPR